MKYIDKLTPEQEALMPAWRDEGIAKGLRCGDADWERFERGIRVAYQKADIPFPENIIRVQSPMVGAFAAAYAELLLRSGSVQDSIHIAIESAVGVALSRVIDKDALCFAGRSIGAEVGRAVLPGHRAVNDSVENAVGEAIHNAVAVTVDDVTNRAVQGYVGDTVQVASAVVRSLDAIHTPVQNSVHTALRDAVNGAVRAAVSNLTDPTVRRVVDDGMDNPLGFAISRVEGPVRRAVYDAVVPAIRNAVHIDGDGMVSEKIRSAIVTAVGDAVNGAVSGDVFHTANKHLHTAIRNAVNRVVNTVAGAVEQAINGDVGQAIHRAMHREMYSVMHNSADPLIGIDAAAPVNHEVSSAVEKATFNDVSLAVSNAIQTTFDRTIENDVARKLSDINRDLVGGAVDDAVHDAVKQAINGDVADDTLQAVLRGVSNVVQGAVHPAVHNQFARGTGLETGSAISRVILDTIRNILRTEKISWHYWLGGQFWIGGWWGGPVYVSFFREVCGLELPDDIAERADAYQDICESVNYVWPNRNFVMVCDRPKHIRRDDEGRLSCDQGQAIEYKDGWGLYALDGVVLEKELWTKIVSKTMTFTEIMQIENADHQVVALKYNPEAILTAGATCIDKSDRGNELYLVKDTDLNTLCDEPQMYFLKMRCPTGRTFIEGVDPEYAKQNPYADHCQAYAFGLTPTTYGFLRQEG